MDKVETNTAVPRGQNLSSLLRSSTMAIHGQVEGGDFMKKIFSGPLTEQDYYLYLWSLVQVYESLENSMAEHQSEQNISPVYFKELLRMSSLQTDMEVWKSFQVEIPESLKKTVHAYCEYLQSLSAQNPSLLVAHAYVRYLGDLSGGQMIAKALGKKFVNSQGLHFYSFDQVHDIHEMKQAYRRGLDQIGSQSPDKVQALCEEAQKAFEWNGKVIQALSIASEGMANGATH